jgi:serine/threonine protein kinase
MKADVLIGKVLGTCTLLRLIGRGGMGAVYLAQQSRPQRQVAVKVLLPDTDLSPARHADFLERFRRETDVVASLIHPNIMPVHEYGEQEGVAYLVMPYISGGTLRDELEQQNTLPLTKIRGYLEQIAAALDFAHGRGVIHRDVKPANLLKTEDGRLLLSDFGLVKVIAAGRAKQSYVPDINLPLGTPDYMAPEQGLGQELDARADLYALGVVLYHMITGHVPFKGDMPMQVLMQHIHVPPPRPCLERVDLPAAAEQVVLKALAKDPAERYASATEMYNAFQQALISAGVGLDNTMMATLAGGGNLKNYGPAGMAQPDSVARSFKSRSLFDPLWQSQSGIALAEEKEPAARLAAFNEANHAPSVQAAPASPVSLWSFAAAAPVAEELSKPATAATAPEKSALFSGSDRVRQTIFASLPPTSSKLISRGEESTMLQKHNMQSLTPKTPEAQTASAPQAASAYPDPSAGNLQPPPVMQPPAATSRFTPEMRTHYNFAASNAPGPSSGPPSPLPPSNIPAQPGGFPAPPTMNNVPGQSAVPSVPPFGSANTTRQLGNPGSPFMPNAPQQPGNAMPPAFTPTNATRKLGGPLVPSGNTGYLGAGRGNTGALIMSDGGYEGQGMTGTMKLTQPVKVVQVPVAGQPGRYMTGFLPVVPSGAGEAFATPSQPTSLKKKLLLASMIVVVALVIFGSGLFLLLRPHNSGQTALNTSSQEPTALTTAQALASATAQANIILEDPLTDHIHNWPLANTGPLQYKFENGAYHVIVNDDNNSALPLLPGETFSGPMAYTITMQEVKGDDTSPYNWFGVVLRYSEHQQDGRTVKTFYCFDYEPADGIYQFRMYNSGFAADASAWSDIWHMRSGREYRTGHRAQNTVKVFANGSDFTFFVNGKRVGETRDNSLTSGQVGMVVNQQGAEVAYSNLILTYN